MSVLVVGRKEVRQLLPMDRCMEAVEQALAALSSGRAVMPQRQVMPLSDGSGVLALMPGHLSEPESLGVKVITVFPENHKKGLDSHQGLVMLFDAGDGRPLALVDAAEITAIRTAAASGVATRLLSRPESRDLVLLGSGVQARAHLTAMIQARPIDRVRVWNPLPGEAGRFAADMGPLTGLEIEALDGPKPDVSGADIICTITPARSVVLTGADLEPGMHINAVGACQPYERELDAAAVALSRLFVDQRSAALAEAGDLLQAVEEGACGLDQVAGELGELILGRVEGRTSADEITLFDSMGVAVEDLASARQVMDLAREAGLGVEVEI